MQTNGVTSGVKFVTIGTSKLSLLSLRYSRFRVHCAVEIVMCLEEEFDISVDEDNSQNITTVQDAADLIEKLVLQKAEAA
ncbi:hypothetical protein BHE74_00020001 [Ensete ventricosum]|uniref:Uncharacterized protein n=1 Tax=Ensete ventricosum TaxID=4639 RepID=A0A444FHS5_ENSVE|nr:hypothetical protein B296_00052148 [Ensete ventricosum]RWW22146.1 hypothetical protein GW17_00013667 [Ensete ventricosum]RWW72205.1 hypothetical protein BHE74_00020001 [Ensete ventricosum]RZS24986.1 hypothetical protein BHM03_00058149 [Ensete ventricosum]